MSSILGIIEQYKSQLGMLPMMIIIFVVLTLLCYIIFNKYSKLKYVPALIGIVAGIIFMVMGVMKVTSPGGLDNMLKGLYLFVAGCIALGTAWLITLVGGLMSNKEESGEKNKKEKKNKEKKVFFWQKDEAGKENPENQEEPVVGAVEENDEDMKIITDETQIFEQIEDGISSIDETRIMPAIPDPGEPTRTRL